MGLEGQSEEADGASLEDFQLSEQLFDDAYALATVDFAGSLNDWHSEPIFGSRGDECGRVFPEAGASPADAWLQESRADARIKADAIGYLGDIGADPFRQSADFIDVTDL